MVGGPAGAVAGGMLASSAGIGCEYGISTTIDDQSVKGNVGDVSIKRFAIDGMVAGILPGGQTAVGRTLDSAVGSMATREDVKTG